MPRACSWIAPRERRSGTSSAPLQPLGRSRHTRSSSSRRAGTAREPRRSFELRSPARARPCRSHSRTNAPRLLGRLREAACWLACRSSERSCGPACGSRPLVALIGSSSCETRRHDRLRRPSWPRVRSSSQDAEGATRAPRRPASIDWATEFCTAVTTWTDSLKATDRRAEEPVVAERGQLEERCRRRQLCDRHLRRRRAGARNAGHAVGRRGQELTAVAVRHARHREERHPGRGRQRLGALGARCRRDGDRAVALRDGHCVPAPPSRRSTTRTPGTSSRRRSKTRPRARTSRASAQLARPTAELV